MTIEDLSWMCGVWQGETAYGFMEESFGPPLGGTILGTSRIATNERTVHREFILLEEREDALYYVVHLPSKAEAFALTQLSADEALFESPTNEFPTHIHYRRQGDTMIAAVYNAQRREEFEMKLVLPR